jgi:DNA repair exonuclease SbcCD ATPase subunit
LLEVEGSGNDFALVLQLKTQLSEQEGQRHVLSQQSQRAEAEAKQALRELERKQCELESLQKELVALRKQQAGFRQIPLPEGMPSAPSDVIASLNEQLLHTLNQLHSREDALEEARDALERLQRKFAVIIHQQGVLYLEYSDSRSKWEKETEHTKLELQRLLAEREEDKIKAQNLEVGTSLSSQGTQAWPDLLVHFGSPLSTLLFRIFSQVYLAMKRR